MKIVQSVTGVCAKQITVCVNNGCMSGVKFSGGCDGNLKAIDSLTSGMPIDWVIERLKDVKCGKKDTSCAAELAKILLKIKEMKNGN